MTAFWIILASIAFMIGAGIARRRPGVAVADASILVFLLGLISVVNMVLSRFFNTGGVAWFVAGMLAFGFALDALYGLMAPERQRRRDRRLRSLMRRKTA